MILRIYKLKIQGKLLYKLKQIINKIKSMDCKNKMILFTINSISMYIISPVSLVSNLWQE